MIRLSIRRLRAFWRRMSVLDRLGVGVIALYALSRATRLAERRVPLTSFLTILFILTLGYFIFRLLPWVRKKILWSLRNRLIVAYVFIAVVPVVLLLTMAGVSFYLLSVQLGAHILQDDVESRVRTLRAVAEAAADAAENQAASAITDAQILSRRSVSSRLEEAREQIPGIRVDLHPGGEFLRGLPNSEAERFAGIVQSGEHLRLEAIAIRQRPNAALVVSVSAPLSSGFLDELDPDLGPIQLTPMRPLRQDDSQKLKLDYRGRPFVPAGQVTSRHRSLPPKANWLDLQVNGSAQFEAVSQEGGGWPFSKRPVLASFSVRPSQLNHRLFASLGALGDLIVGILIAVVVVFLILEVAALVTGVVLTRTITNAVAGLYEATQHIRRGDFAHRVRLQRRDQLGVLGESFNAMTSSVAELIEEQRQRQRLENELSIAREVQSQLFPHTLPSLPGLQLAAVCRPARVVSGDYYDFISLGPTRLGMAVADISGKGISAALLMASLQAALRSQALLDGHTSTAELVSRLNRHLFLNTSDDRYATFFYAVYDAASRTLSYTNAGHVPPFYVEGDRVKKLDEGGTVVGLFDNCEYVQGVFAVAPGSWLVAYSDGLVEPENVYGEEFGQARLIQEVLRHRESPSQLMAESLLGAAEQWAGTPEQADDMTVVVARLG
jgi:sigma-B regulation protein RsbU (phosphoserine phosphatase)